jgi:hypothetical protein
MVSNTFVYDVYIGYINKKAEALLAALNANAHVLKLKNKACIFMRFIFRQKHAIICAYWDDHNTIR